MDVWVQAGHVNNYWVNGEKQALPGGDSANPNLKVLDGMMT